MDQYQGLLPRVPAHRVAVPGGPARPPRGPGRGARARGAALPRQRLRCRRAGGADPVREVPRARPRAAPGSREPGPRPPPLALAPGGGARTAGRGRAPVREGARLAAAAVRLGGAVLAGAEETPPAATPDGVLPAEELARRQAASERWTFEPVALESSAWVF